jgi:hypothetical protein
MNVWDAKAVLKFANPAQLQWKRHNTLRKMANDIMFPGLFP